MEYAEGGDMYEVLFSPFPFSHNQVNREAHSRKLVYKGKRNLDVRLRSLQGSLTPSQE